MVEKEVCKYSVDEFSGRGKIVSSGYLDWWVDKKARETVKLAINNWLITLKGMEIKPMENRILFISRAQSGAAFKSALHAKANELKDIIRKAITGVGYTPKLK